jgi:hypothetical protein
LLAMLRDAKAAGVIGPITGELLPSARWPCERNGLRKESMTLDEMSPEFFVCGEVSSLPGPTTWKSREGQGITGLRR